MTKDFFSKLNSDILSKIFVESQNVRFYRVCTTFNEISKNPTNRANFFHKRFKENGGISVLHMITSFKNISNFEELIMVFINRGIYPTYPEISIVDKIMVHGWSNVLQRLLMVATVSETEIDDYNQHKITPIININEYKLSSFEAMIKNGHYDVLRLLYSAHEIKSDSIELVDGDSDKYSLEKDAFIHSKFKLKVYETTKVETINTHIIPNQNTETYIVSKDLGRFKGYDVTHVGNFMETDFECSKEHNKPSKINRFGRIYSMIKTVGQTLK
ncbi:hypothetical protein AYI69_g7106 [Smittium culicis]|uniref:Uncharacterized protein n=1 Tax=Smittium culicis TaxID=133412 RepID=A0A1R1XJ01_9FUNG|nr:hypothetical protein AYI69_g8521 [Smittium culicis]OMJ18259.1 hypothetical protein AYI69_g7106 [Smittium culicis]